jgi:GMP synthase (glutamine-hydrolysing)
MIGIIDFGSKKTANIADVLNKLGSENKILPWHECDESKLKSLHAIILSGAPVLLTEIDYQPYLDQFGFLKRSSIPVLGICFGHQLIGLLFGSQVFKGKEIRELTEIEVLKENDLFKGIPVKAMMMEDHTEGITLPANFNCFAKSDSYAVEVMIHISQPIYGVQFHPEVSGLNGEKLLMNFLASSSLAAKGLP